MGDEYIDYNLVLVLETGRLCENRVIGNQFERLKKSAGLPNVVFHSLRHRYVKLKAKNNCKTAITSMRFHTCNCCLYIREKSSKQKQH